MSVSERQSIDDALMVARELHIILGPCCDRIEIAGSVRRASLMVGDIEVVAVPAVTTAVPPGELLPREFDMLMHKLDMLVADQTIQKTIRDGGRTCWGPRHRSFVFEGTKIDLFLADDRNWGSILSIRTGPAELSQMLVSRLHLKGLCHKDGYVRNQIYGREPMNGEMGEIVPCETEEDFFAMCDVPYIQPNERDDWRSKMGGI